MQHLSERILFIFKRNAVQVLELLIAAVFVRKLAHKRRDVLFCIFFEACGIHVIRIS